MGMWRLIEIIVLVILIAITSVAYVKARKEAYLAAKAQDEAEKKEKQNEITKVILTVKIDGMMCEKCAIRVSDALAKYGEIAINLEEKAANITAYELPDTEEIKKEIETLGYTFIGIE